MTTIGYLVPEFPGQTHNFFWREVLALREMDTEARLISTRRPPPALMSTSWGADAGGMTSYLFPLKLADLARLVAVLASAGPAAWRRCLGGILRAKGVKALQRLRMLGLLLMAAKLVHLARSQGWRHVHVHSCGDAANVALLAKWLGGIEYSLTLHNALGASGGNQPLKWRNASFAVVITQTLLREVRSTLREDLPARIGVAPMGVDAAFFSRPRPYAVYGGAGSFRVFSCGRLNPGKGQRFLIGAVARLLERGRRVTLALAGEDDAGGRGYRLELEGLIRRMGLERQVQLLGALPEAGVREQLMHCHAFALASLQEALGVAIMEAMAMEVPVVATRVGGVSELVADGADGLLVPPGDAAALAQALDVIAGQPALAAELSCASRAKIVARFPPSGGANLIHRLLAGRP